MLKNFKVGSLMKKTVFTIEMMQCPTCKAPIRITKRYNDVKIGYCDKCGTEKKFHEK